MKKSLPSTIEYEITFKQPDHFRQATLPELTADEIQALIQALEDEMSERE